MNVSAYQFVALNDLLQLRDQLKQQCLAFSLKGTILLSSEGINFNLAGKVKNMQQFQSFLAELPYFNPFAFKESHSADIPFRRLLVKVKKEIITYRHPEVNPLDQRAPVVAPQILKQWLDEQRDIILVDTRNDYEIKFGTFRDAVHFNLNDFSAFPEASSNFNPIKPVVTFCTGGVRCEKAALSLQKQGIKEIYQLDGGILNYFKQCGDAHYEGECFVFDERVSLDSKLAVSGTVQCQVCAGPVSQVMQQMPQYRAGVSCPSCLGEHQLLS